MTALTQRAHVTNQPAETAVKQPRFGGILWRFSRRTSGWAWRQRFGLSNSTVYAPLSAV
jgi:hypothetical protein